MRTGATIPVGNLMVWMTPDGLGPITISATTTVSTERGLVQDVDSNDHRCRPSTICVHQLLPKQLQMCHELNLYVHCTIFHILCLVIRSSGSRFFHYHSVNPIFAFLVLLSGSSSVDNGLSLDRWDTSPPWVPRAVYHIRGTFSHTLLIMYSTVVLLGLQNTTRAGQAACLNINLEYEIPGAPLARYKNHIDSAKLHTYYQIDYRCLAGIALQQTFHS